ncbi:glycosyltransferase [Clostridium formicaceticum]|uniref:2-deoxystreptamine glucosyltransferase n=1 Tax=Clostridium formicaceticum TaxID=1497 RepID=A0AAC9RHI4_9CLOT|nr:glycosyltransferase [Clostridium formicaceticum]AOY75603.1 hypothetical protein BJL90_06680 [Clostridium formicaceticum]ARE85912.1 2-deoxystreptamine glucosyltransferase [Clostridium formicaceticum]
MVGLFVHDHRFPKIGDDYYFSYGFDEEFFNRYVSIFGSIEIIGRETIVDNGKYDRNNLVDKRIKLTTIKNLKELKEKDIREKIKERIQQSDYIVIRMPSILGIYAAKWAKKYRKPYLTEVVGCAWDAIANKGIRHFPEALVVMYLMKKIVADSKYVVYVTEEFLQRRYPTKGKTIACSNVTLESVAQDDLIERLKKIENIDFRNKIVLGTCATIDVVYKGQEDVIKAIAILKREGYDIKYQLVGGGSKEYLKKNAIENGVLDQIEFIGSLKHEDVFKWLDNIDIYVHPSKQEGLSRAIIEAMSKGCPIFGADAGGIHEQIDDQFIFEKGNVNDICSIFKQFNIDIMKEQAIKNHEKSKQYLKKILYSRRESFFKNFIEEN